MADNIDIDNLSKDEELEVFRLGVESAFWRLVVKKFSPLLNGLRGALEAPTTPSEQRTFIAGKLQGAKMFLRWPEAHIQTLKVGQEVRQRKAEDG